MKIRSVLIFATLVIFTVKAAPLSAQPAKMQGAADPLKRGLYLASRRYPEEAVSEFKKCADFATADATQLKIIAQCFYDIGDMTGALKVCDYALSQERVKKNINMEVSICALRGDCLASNNRTDEAVASFKQAAILSPSTAYSSFSKAGSLLVKKHRYKEALPILEKSLPQNPMNGFVHQHIGECYIELKEPARAIEPLLASIDDFEKYRKKKPDAFMPALIQSHQILIKAYDAAGNHKESLIWQKRLQTHVDELNHDFFGK